MCGMKSLVHSQTSTVAILKFGNGKRFHLCAYNYLSIVRFSLIHFSKSGFWLLLGRFQFSRVEVLFAEKETTEVVRSDDDEMKEETDKPKGEKSTDPPDAIGNSSNVQGRADFVVACCVVPGGWLLLIDHVDVTHYDDVIMTTVASQITSLTVGYSTVYSDQRKHQSSASLAFVWGIHRDRWIPRTKGQLRGKWRHHGLGKIPRYWNC